LTYQYTARARYTQQAYTTSLGESVACQGARKTSHDGRVENQPL